MKTTEPPRGLTPAGAVIDDVIDHIIIKLDKQLGDAERKVTAIKLHIAALKE